MVVGRRALIDVPKLFSFSTQRLCFASRNVSWLSTNSQRPIQTLSSQFLTPTSCVLIQRRMFLIQAAKRYWNTPPGTDFLVLCTIVFFSAVYMQGTLVFEIIEKFKQRQYLKYYRPDGTLRSTAESSFPPFSSDIDDDAHQLTPFTNSVEDNVKEKDKETHISQSHQVASSLLYDEETQNLKESKSSIYIDTKRTSEIDEFMSNCHNSLGSKSSISLDQSTDSKNGISSSINHPENIETIYNFTYVIVGSGFGGFTAAKSIMEHHPTANVLIVTNESYPPYRKTLLSNQFLSNSTQFKDENLHYDPPAIQNNETNHDDESINRNHLKLCYENDAFYLDPKKANMYKDEFLPIESFDVILDSKNTIMNDIKKFPGIYLLKNVEAIDLDQTSSKLICQEIKKSQSHVQYSHSSPFAIEYGQILIATGAKFISNPIMKQIDRSKIIGLSNIKDYMKLLEILKVKSNDANIVVFGVSPQSLEMCVALKDRNISNQITLLRPGKENKFNEIIWYNYIKELFDKLNIKIITDFQLDSIKTLDNSDFITIKGKNESQNENIDLKADLIVVHDEPRGNIDFIRKNTQITQNIDLDTNQLKCTPTMNVMDNIWTCGDVCYIHHSKECKYETDKYENFYFNSPGLLRTENQARIAAHNMVMNQLYDNSLKNNKNLIKSMKYFGSNDNDILNYFWSDLTPNISYETIGNCDIINDATNTENSKSSNINSITFFLNQTHKNISGENKESFLEPSITFYVDQPLNFPQSHIYDKKELYHMIDSYKCKGIMLFNIDNIIQSLRPILNQNLKVTDMMEISKEIWQIIRTSQENIDQ